MKYYNNLIENGWSIKKEEIERNDSPYPNEWWTETEYIISRLKNCQFLV